MTDNMRQALANQNAKSRQKESQRREKVTKVAETAAQTLATALTIAALL